jgi:hypothetical protein
MANRREAAAARSVGLRVSSALENGLSRSVASALAQACARPG